MHATFKDITDFKAGVTVALDTATDKAVVVADPTNLSITIVARENVGYLENGTVIDTAEHNRYTVTRSQDGIQKVIGVERTMFRAKDLCRPFMNAEQQFKQTGHREVAVLPSVNGVMYKISSNKDITS